MFKPTLLNRSIRNPGCKTLAKSNPCSISLIFLLIPVILMAQVNQPTYEIDTVFVTASRVEEPISQIPLSTILISEEAIRLRNFGDISSILYSNPGIDVRAYTLIGGATSLSLFGSSSQQVLVLLDGRTINSPNLGVPDLGLISTDDLKKVEIVNGPISSLYGANAMGGVVNFVTKSPFDFPKSGAYYNASLLYGSFQTSRIHLGTGLSGNNLGILLNGHRENSHGYRTNDDCLKQGIELKAGYHNNNNRLRFDFGYETKENGLPGPKPSPSLIPQYGDSSAASIYDRTSDTAYFLRADWNWNLSPGFSLEFMPSFSKNRTRFLWVDSWSEDTSLYQDRYDTKVLGGNLLASYQYVSGFRINGGVDFKQDDFEAQSFIFDELSFEMKDTVWQAQAQRVGVFGEANIVMGNVMTIIPALRIDWNSDFGNFLSPSLGFLFPLSSEFRLRTHLGRAFRAPTFNDLYWPKSGNPEIKPEFGDAIQLGMDWKGDEGQSFSLTAFARKTKDLIAWVPDTAGIWRPTNIDEADIFGISTKGKVRLLKGFAFGYALNLSKANQIRKEMVYSDWATGTTRFELKKRRAAFLPGFTLSQEISYQNDFGTNLGLEFREIGNRVNYYTTYDSLPKVYMTTKTLPFDFVVNLRVRQRLFAGGELIFRIENLLNQDYAEQFGNSPDDLDYPRPKLTIFSELRIGNF